MDPADGNIYPHLTGLENMTPLGTHLPSPTAPYAASANRDVPSSARVWHGRLHVRGYRNDMTVCVAADAHTTPGRAAVNDTRLWPSDLHCDSSRVKTCAQVFADMDHPSSQWFVRLFAISDIGGEMPSAQIGQLAAVMIERQLAFDIPCAGGALFLWAMEMPRHGNSILGVFRPRETPMQMTGYEEPFGGLENMLPLAEHLPAAAWEGANRDGRVWEGTLYVRGHANDLELHCVAVPHAVAGRQEVREARSWPGTIVCDSARVKSCDAIFQYMDEEMAQWYVRIVAVDENRVERREGKLVELVKVLAQSLLAFEIPCEERGGRRGVLYLWGMEMATVGHSLLAVFRPIAEE